MRGTSQYPQIRKTLPIGGATRTLEGIRDVVLEFLPPVKESGCYSRIIAKVAWGLGRRFHSVRDG